MTYYIMLPGDTEKDCYRETNLLGEQSFKVFWSGLGLKALMAMVKKNPDLINEVRIKTDRNETLSVEQFLDRIDNLQIRYNF
jgi:hypothetical protein